MIPNQTIPQGSAAGKPRASGDDPKKETIMTAWSK